MTEVWSAVKKQGFSILVMSIALWFLYNDNVVYREETRQELEALREQSNICNEFIRNTLIDQLDKNNEALINFEKSHQNN